jgi:hypothetical protein
MAAESRAVSKMRFRHIFVLSVKAFPYACNYKYMYPDGQLTELGYESQIGNAEVPVGVGSWRFTEYSLSRPG